jgi:methylated-DNA-[protein]-cysteine S-methyltransferase
MACARNPIPIIVPCHRVLGSGGKEGGFSGGRGLPTKRQLLALEGVVLP